MRHLGAVAAMLGLLAAGLPALAEDSGRLLRVLGEAAAPAPGMPARVVIDAVLKDGGDPFKAEVDGWIAPLVDESEGAEIEGACVEARCALSATLGDGKLAISADLAGPGAPGGGRMVLTDGEGARVAETAVRFTAITGPVAGLGELAAPDAIGASELSDLLMWNGSATGFSNSSDEAVDWLQRGAVAEWQATNRRPGAGLILVEDLALLRDRARAAKEAVGWTPLGGKGWSAGYPAKLLPKAETAGTEQRFTSLDGKRRLVIAIDPPISGEAFDAFVETATEDRPGYETGGYTRVNDDMEITWEEGGRRVHGAYHRRDGGVARLEYSVPAAEDEGDGEPDLAVILTRSLRAEEALAR